VGAAFVFRAITEIMFNSFQHFHLRLAWRILELGSLRVFALDLFSCPADLAQYDFLRLASLEPFFGFPVTAVCSFEPGLARRYAATPFAVMPAPDFVGL